MTGEPVAPVREGSVRLRPGTSTDAPAILELWDEAIAWLVGRGQTGQWGGEPASSREGSRSRARDWAEHPGLTVAELDGQPVGVCVLRDERPSYVPSARRPETYVLLLLTSRRHSGREIGSMLVRDAAEQARARGAELLRVDCWARAPSLVAWYERQGFEQSATFEIDGWQGQVFEKAL